MNTYHNTLLRYRKGIPAVGKERDLLRPHCYPAGAGCAQLCVIPHSYGMLLFFFFRSVGFPLYVFIDTMVMRFSLFFFLCVGLVSITRFPRSGRRQPAAAAAFSYLYTTASG